MKKEISPIVVAGVLLLVLVGVLAAYWHGLGPQPVLLKPANPDDALNASGNADEESEAALPPQRGSAAVVVSTLAGSPDPGFVDGSAPAARFDGPAALAVDAGGVLYVADSRNHALRKITPDGRVSTLAGGPVPGQFGGYADGPGRTARFCAPAGVVALPDGTLVVADTGNHRLRRIARDGAVSTLAGAGTPCDRLGQPQGGYRDGPALHAQFRFPTGLAVDAEGAIYIADTGNGQVRRLAGGVVTTVAGDGGMRAPTAVLTDAGSSLIVSDSLGSSEGGAGMWAAADSGPLSSFVLQNTPKDEREAVAPLRFPLGLPAGLAYTSRPDDPPDSPGQMASFFFVDAGSHCLNWSGNDERMPWVVVGEGGTPGYVDGTGDVARFCTPSGLAARPGGTLYVADFGNNCIRKVELKRWWLRDLPTWFRYRP